MTKNTALTELYCYSNQLTALDVTKNTALTELDCSSNQLTSLDVSKNTALTSLSCYSNQLTSLDVSVAAALTNLECYSNQLTSLDVSKNTALWKLRCWNSSLRSIQVSSAAIEKTPIYLYDGSQTSWTFKNASGTTLGTTTASSSSFYCIPTELPVYATNKEGTQAIAFTLQDRSLEEYDENEINCLSAFLEQTNSYGIKNGTRINFSYYNSSIPATWTGIIWNVIDGKVRATSINWDDENLSGALDLSGCTALKSLSCNSNELTSLDVSKNTALTSLSCSSNQLTSLNVSGAIALTTLYCYSNQLTSLNVSGAIALTTLYCYSNQLTSLNVSGAAALTHLYCYSNQLTSLDVSKNTALTSLSCGSNQLTSLDVSGATALTSLSCGSNQLTSLDVSGATALTDLKCFSNQLTSLDVSKNTALTMLYCSSNKLTSLDVSKNTALTYLYCWNSGLQSVQMSSAAIGKTMIYLYDGSKTTWTFKNASGTTLGTTTANNSSYYTPTELPVYATNAAGTQTIEFTLPVPVPEGYAESDYNCLKTFLEQTDSDGVKNGTKLNSSYSATDPTTWKGVTWEEIDGVKKVTKLSWSSKNLSGSLDLSGCTALTELSCSSNQLTSLDVSKNSALTELSCHSNQLTLLDVSMNTALDYFDCRNNKLTLLDVSKNTALDYFDCSNNKLTSLDVSKNTALYFGDFSLNQLASLNVSKNNALKVLKCHSNQLTTLDVSKNTSLAQLYCFSNQLTTLDVSKNITLTHLECWNSYLQSVQMSSSAIGETSISLFYGSSASWTFKNASGTALVSNTYSSYTPTELPVYATNAAGTQTIAFTLAPQAAAAAGNRENDFAEDLPAGSQRSQGLDVAYAGANVSLTGYSGTYTGEAHSVIVSGATAGDTVLYSTDGTNYYYDAPQLIDVGTTTVYVQVWRDGEDVWTGSTSVSISKAQLFASVGNSQITYGDAPVYNVTYSGFVGNDTAGTALTGSAAFAGYSVGGNVGGYTIIASGLSAKNYTITYMPGTLTVNKKAISVGIASVDTRAFDGSQAASGAYKLNGIVGDDSIALSGAAFSYDSANAGTGKTVTLSGYSLSGSDAGNYTLNNSTATTNSGVIEKAAITVKVNDSSAVYGNELAYTASYFNANGVSVLASGLGLTGTLTFAGYSRYGDVGVYEITASGQSAANYSFQYESGTLTVTARPLTVSIASVTPKKYDSTTIGDGTYALTGKVNGDSVELDGCNYLFSDANVGTGKTVILSGYYLVGAKAGNYQLANLSASKNIGTITKATLNAVVGNTEITYGTTPSLAVSYSGFVGTENSQNLIGTLQFAESTGKSLNQLDAGSYSITASGVSSSNYEIAYQPGELTVNRKPVAVRVDSVESRAYDGTTSATGAYQLDGLLSGDDLTLSGAAFAYLTPNAGENKTVTLSGYQLGGADAGNYILANGTASADCGVVTKANLTVRVEDSSVTYGDEANYNLSYDGLSAFDTESVLGGSLQVAGYQPGYRANADGYTVTPSGLESDNYDIQYEEGTLVVEKKRISVVIESVENKAYDGTAAIAANCVAYDLDGLVGNDKVLLQNVSAAYRSTEVGTDNTLVLSYDSALAGDDADNYEIVQEFASTTAGIEKATLYVSVDDLTIQYGEDPSLTVSYSGYGENENFINDVSGVLSLAGYEVNGAAGEYAIAASGLTSDVYNIVYQYGTLTVEPKEITVSIGSVDAKSFDGSAGVSGTYVLSGVQDGDSVSLTNAAFAFDSAAAGENKTVTLSGYSLSGDDAGNYTIVNASAIGTGTIAKATLAATVESTEITYGDAPVFNVSFSGFIGTDTAATVLTGSAAYSGYEAGGNVGTYSVSVSGLNSDNYNIVCNAGTLTVNPKPITVVIDSIESKTYDATSAGSGSYRLDGLLTGDSVDLANAQFQFASAHAGDDITVTLDGFQLSGDDAGNYVLTNQSATGTANIDKAPLTVTVNAQSAVYGENPEYSVSISGFAGYEDDAVLSGALSFSGYDQFGNVGQYSISASGLESNDYQFEYKTGALTVTPKELSIAVASIITKTYDGTRSAQGSYSIGGIENYDDVELTGCVYEFNSADAGEFKTATLTGFSLSGSDAGNYTLGDQTIATGMGEIEKATFGIASATIQKSYDGTDELLFDHIKTYQLSGVLAGETVTLTDVSGHFDSAEIGTRTAVITSAILSGSDAANYQFLESTITENVSIIADSTSELAVELIPVTTLTGADTADSLPTGITSIREGKTFYLEVWVRNTELSTAGVHTGYVNLSFDAAALTAVSFTHSGLYPFFNSEPAVIDNEAGTVSYFGGSRGTSNNPVYGDNEWISLGYITMTADAEGSAAIRSSGDEMYTFACPAVPGVQGSEEYKTDLIRFGTAELTIDKSCIYDLNGDNKINGVDLANFAVAWMTLPSYENWNAACDFNNDGKVNGVDLSFFATAWMKMADDATIVYPGETAASQAASEVLAEAAEGTEAYNTYCALAAAMPDPVSVERISDERISDEPAVLETADDLLLQVSAVAVNTLSAAETADQLPTGISQVEVDDSFYVELWVRNTELSTAGISTGYLDVYYGSSFDASSFTHSSLFQPLTAGDESAVIDNEAGKLALFGGTRGTSYNPVYGDDEWVCLGYITMTAGSNETANAAIEPQSCSNLLYTFTSPTILGKQVSYEYLDSDILFTAACVSIVDTAVYAVENDFVKTTLDLSIEIDVLANDTSSSGKPLTITTIGQPTHGTAVLDALTGIITYTPDEGFYGTDAFGCIVTDPRGEEHVSAASVEVCIPISPVVAASASASSSEKKPESVKQVSDWDNLVVEFWTNSLPSVGTGAFSTTLEYNAALYDLVPEVISTQPGVSAAVSSERFDESTGMTTVELTFEVSDELSSSADIFWGAVELKPKETIVLNAGEQAAKTICLGDEEIKTEVMGMPYDLMPNGVVDMQDFIQFAKLFNQKVEDNPNPLVKVADFDGSKTVDMQDFIQFAKNFNKKKPVEIAPKTRAAVSSALLGNEPMSAAAAVLEENASDDQQPTASDDGMSSTTNYSQQAARAVDAVFAEDSVFAEAVECPTSVWIPGLDSETVEWYWKKKK